MVFGRWVASLHVSIVLNITAILLKVSDVSDEDVLHQQLPSRQLEWQCGYHSRQCMHATTLNKLREICQ